MPTLETCIASDLEPRFIGTSRGASHKPGKEGRHGARSTIDHVIWNHHSLQCAINYTDLCPVCSNKVLIIVSVDERVPHSILFDKQSDNNDRTGPDMAQALISEIHKTVLHVLLCIPIYILRSSESSGFFLSDSVEEEEEQVLIINVFPLATVTFTLPHVPFSPTKCLPKLLLTPPGQ